MPSTNIHVPSVTQSPLRGHFLFNAIDVMPEGGELQDRVGTSIRNKNLESNVQTHEIRFQFNILGKGFEFKVTHETENLRWEKLNYNSVAKEISKLPFLWLLKSSGHQSLPCLFDSRFL